MMLERDTERARLGRRIDRLLVSFQLPWEYERILIRGLDCPELRMLMEALENLKQSPRPQWIDPLPMIEAAFSQAA